MDLAVKPIVIIVFLVVVSIWTPPEALATRPTVTDGKITFCMVAYTDINTAACDGLPLQLSYPVIFVWVLSAWFRAEPARLAEASTAADMMYQRVRPQLCAISYCNAWQNTISCMCSVPHLC
jgi:hypothetical protein